MWHTCIDNPMEPCAQGPEGNPFATVGSDMDSYRDYCDSREAQARVVGGMKIEWNS